MVVLYCESSRRWDLFTVDDVVAPVVPDVAELPYVLFVVFIESVDGPLDWGADLVVDLVVHRREKRGAGRDVFPVLLLQDSLWGFCWESVDGPGYFLLVRETIQVEETSDDDHAIFEAIGQQVVHGCSESILSAVVPPKDVSDGSILWYGLS